MIKFCTNLIKRLTNLADKCLCKVNIEDITTTAVVIAAVSLSLTLYIDSLQEFLFVNFGTGLFNIFIGYFELFCSFVVDVAHLMTFQVFPDELRLL